MMKRSVGYWDMYQFAGKRNIMEGARRSVASVAPHSKISVENYGSCSICFSPIQDHAISLSRDDSQMLLDGEYATMQDALQKFQGRRQHPALSGMMLLVELETRNFLGL